MTDLLMDREAVFVAAALRRIESTVADFGQITRHLSECGASSFKIAAIARAVVALEDARRALSSSSEVTP